MDTLANNVHIYSFLVKFAKSIPLLLELIMCEHEAINKYNYMIFMLGHCWELNCRHFAYFIMFSFSTD